MATTQTRRRVLTALSLLSAAPVLHVRPALAGGEALETTVIRMYRDPSTCTAPALIADDLLRAEGFTEIRNIELAANALPEAMASDPVGLAIGRGEMDFGFDFPSLYITSIEAGAPITVLAGVHIGCFELFAKESIRSIADLKGKSVGLKAAPPTLLMLIAAHVGLDPRRDVRWVTSTDPKVDPFELFVAGQIDAFLGFPPEPQELRARRIGHVIVSTATDLPWSQYFCCMLLGNRDFVRDHPVATKRVLRAILKATDLCASEPARVAQRLVERGFTQRCDFALQGLREVAYDKWREYDPEDSIRFFALRLHEVELITSTPQKIISRGTDWRFLDKVKRELKA
jgi:NitT/TauT family transport system substrate-binding protein